MGRRVRSAMLVLAPFVLLSACSQSKRTDTPPPTDEKAAALATAIELTPARIAELGQVAALMEKDTAMRATILQQHGFTQEQMDQALARISSDPNLMAMFTQAKTAAAAAPTPVEASATGAAPAAGTPATGTATTGTTATGQ